MPLNIRSAGKFSWAVFLERFLLSFEAEILALMRSTRSGSTEVGSWSRTRCIFNGRHALRLGTWHIVVAVGNLYHDALRVPWNSVRFDRDVGILHGRCNFENLSRWFCRSHTSQCTYPS